MVCVYDFDESETPRVVTDKNAVVIPKQVKFKRPVVPGDQLVTKAHIVKVRGDFGLLHCDGYVNDQLVASADFKFAMRKEENM